MAVNIFEGARRIAKVVAAIWALGVCAWVWMQEPDIGLVYIVTPPDFNPIRIEDCNERDWRSA